MKFALNLNPIYSQFKEEISKHKWHNSQTLLIFSETSRALIEQ